jgi:hypothetical protein
MARCCWIAAAPASAEALSHYDIRHDHQRTQQQAAEHQAAAAAKGHMRHEMHQEHPERIDADGYRDRIDHRGKRHRAWTAIQ